MEANRKRMGKDVWVLTMNEEEKDLYIKQLEDELFRLKKSNKSLRNNNRAMLQGMSKLQSKLSRYNNEYKMLTLKSFLEKYDNWNGKTRINDDNLDTIVEDETVNIYDNRKDLLEMQVVSFGFYDGVMTVRVK